MRRVFADLIAYAKQMFRSPTAAFFTLFFPIVLILVFGAVFGNPAEIRLQVHVQDLDDSVMSSALIEAVNQTGVSVMTISSSENLTAFIRDQSIPVALQIHLGFEAEVQAAKGQIEAGNPFVPPVNVTLHGDTTSSAFQAVEGAVWGAVTGLNFELYTATPIVGVETQGLGDGGGEGFVSGLDFYVPGVIGIAVLTPIFFTSAMAAEYRERQYFKLLATTPLRKSEYLLARTGWMVGIIFLSTFLLILVARAVFGTLYMLDLVSVALIAAGSVLFISVGVAIGNFAKSADAASAIANVIYFPMMFLTGTFFPLELMPDFMQTVSRFLPLAYFNEGLRDTLIFGNIPGALVNLGIVAVLAVVFFILSAWSLTWRAE